MEYQQRVYDFTLIFSDFLPKNLASLKTSKSLVIFEDKRIKTSSFPLTLIYKNNQERDVTLATDREFTKPIQNQQWLLHVENVISFVWETQSNRISYRLLEEATTDIFKFWLYHIVLPIYFSIGEVYKFLHAGAVEIEEKSVLFMAPSHGGKSTLTDYFIKQGHRLVTDDKLATYEENGNYFAVPSHPYHRPYRKVEVLGDFCDKAATSIRPIHAIYVLDKRERDAKVTIRELKGVEKFSRLHEGGEMNFSFFTPEYVKYLGKLANRVRVFSIIVPHDIKRLEEVYLKIKEHTTMIKGVL